MSASDPVQKLLGEGRAGTTSQSGAPGRDRGRLWRASETAALIAGTFGWVALIGSFVAGFAGAEPLALRLAVVSAGLLAWSAAVPLAEILARINQIGGWR